MDRPSPASGTKGNPEGAEVSNIKHAPAQPTVLVTPATAASRGPSRRKAALPHQKPAFSPRADELAEVDTTRSRLSQGGYAPVEVFGPWSNVKKPGKQPTTNEWQMTQRGFQIGSRADAIRCNTGIVTTGLRGFDIDVDHDDVLVSSIIEIIGRHSGIALNDLMIRWRENSTRKTVLLRAAEGEPDSEETVIGAKGKVEVLGKDRQVVVDGWHTTGAKLQWQNPPWSVPLASIPAVTQDQVDRIIEDIEKFLPAASISNATSVSTPGAMAQGQQGTPLIVQANDELAAGIEGSTWFDKLPPEQKDEALDYALETIATRTKFLELERHGGNYGKYYRILQGVARSGAPSAEDLFVKYASPATDSDTEAELRTAYQSCATARKRVNGITVGTPLKFASDSGADFSRWWSSTALVPTPPNIPPSSGARVVYTPGNEEACRRTVDAAVEADPRCFVLDDGSLVILRVPSQFQGPANIEWARDMPITTAATTADVMEIAESVVWLKPGDQGNVRIFPPSKFLADYLIQRRCKFPAPHLVGIARVPRIKNDGEIGCMSGYDATTGIFHDNVPVIRQRSEPADRATAIKLAEVLLDPFSEYQLADPLARKALLLAAILTALERPFLPTAPMIVVRSPMASTGKGKLIGALVELAFGTPPTTITWGDTNEEFQKRLSSVLMRSAAAILIDNANGRMISGDLLESVITEGVADIRVLGGNEIVRTRNRSLILLTGNNPQITGDMARRALVIDIVPKSPDPESEVYPFEPVDVMRRNRDTFLMVAFDIMQSWRKAGMPTQGLPAVGSFDVWSRKVRDLVYWLTGYDLSQRFRQNKEEDPKRQNDAELLSALYDLFGSNIFTVADAVAIHAEVSNHLRAFPTHVPDPKKQLIHDTLETVLGARKVDTKILGYWVRRMKNAHIAGFVLSTERDTSSNASRILIRRP